MEIVVASHNPGKMSELKRLLDHLPVKIYSLDDFESPPPLGEKTALSRDLVTQHC